MGAVGTRILSVEDDERIRTAVKLALEDEGWTVDEAGSGEEAIELFNRATPDVVLIDIMLPGMDGFELCRTVRRHSDVPIVMVTARNDTHDVVAGLEAGADDYLTKPFEVAELLARLRALARRPQPVLQPVLTYLDLTVDPNSRQVDRAGAGVALTNREYGLLEYLVRNPGRIHSRGAIIDHVWDDNFDPIGNVVDVLVGRVRRKIDRPGLVPLIHTVRGAGYLFGERPPDGA
jgi:DNA-binding response OmpR family regulator